MCRRRITLYVDIVSPFAYIAFYILKNSKVFQQVELEFVPILLGGLMKICGNTPPLRIKNKDKWISTESQRLSKHFNVPISQDTPPGFPVNTLPIQRALVSLSLSHPQKVERAIELFYQNFWEQWNDPTKPETLQAILKTVLDSDEEARKVIERTRTEEIKQKLGKNTTKAFEDGAFGLPWFVATNASGETRGYWGVDHIGELCEHLGLKRPFDTEWRSLL
uniref:Glutathione S-transferase kappa n=1 Tax=Alternaria alternata TaxID=5599 RepID=C9K7G3_ALTAL|nr:similar to 2-hydroxychromene-2-carboxylate isomerase [Alternaria alternata]